MAAIGSNTVDEPMLGFLVKKPLITGDMRRSCLLI
jgi:hypothetical protein